MTQDQEQRNIRADAQRKLSALLTAAKDVFAASGVDAPVREIAEKAGVGLGTVYRHFPKRSDLIRAVFQKEVDACAASVDMIAAKYPPAEALSRWIGRYQAFIATKQGLATALHSGDPAYEGLPEYFDEHLQPALQRLLKEAADARVIRMGVDAGELLRAIAILSCTPGYGGPEFAKRMVSLLLDGLRHGTGVHGRR